MQIGFGVAVKSSITMLLSLAVKTYNERLLKLSDRLNVTKWLKTQFGKPKVEPYLLLFNYLLH